VDPGALRSAYVACPQANWSCSSKTDWQPETVGTHTGQAELAKVHSHPVKCTHACVAQECACVQRLTWCPHREQTHTSCTVPSKVWSSPPEAPVVGRSGLCFFAYGCICIFPALSHSFSRNSFYLSVFAKSRSDSLSHLFQPCCRRAGRSRLVAP
jgi:hypothetical protein